ncbi:MAG: BirA family transcriptional regulator [Chloroflexi bacterium]|jgi:BirA family biotin operon repressor/biotin-[acetyl-CoA-carboxylase] ligase|nr:MAG: BirA family transcriptional regulator [Chloroflexota bacterium]
MNNFDKTSYLNNLKTMHLGKQVFYKTSTGSTMDDARNALKMQNSEALHGSLFLSNEQLKGRGRGQKTWSSNPGSGIYVTFLLKYDEHVSNFLYMISSLAICDAIEDLINIQTSIKWPNDIMHQNKKVAGILIENVIDDKEGVSLIGMGINMRNSELLPDEYRENSTDLEKMLNFNNCNNAAIDNNEIFLSSLSTNFEKRYYQSISDSVSLYNNWRILVSTIGKNIIAHLDNVSLHGKVVDISDHGVLILENEEGKYIEVMAASIEELN